MNHGSRGEVESNNPSQVVGGFIGVREKIIMALENSPPSPLQCIRVFQSLVVSQGDQETGCLFSHNLIKNLE